MSIISGANAVTGAGAVSYQIERSLRFNSADSAYLSRTFTTPTNAKKFTISAWVKITSPSGSLLDFGLLSAPDSTDIIGISGAGAFGVSVNNRLIIRFGDANLVYYPRVFRDVSAWAHIVVAIDTDQAVQADRAKFYYNGVLQTATSSTITSGYSPVLNTAATRYIGGLSTFSGYYANGYLAEYHFIDGQALDASYFGETNTDTGVWQPKAYTGSYGTNGFYLDFADNSSTTALGYDAAGSNDWTPNNFSVTAGAGNDSLVDTPTNYGTDTGVGGEVRGNYCTWNAVSGYAVTLTNGNLDYTTGTSSNPVTSTWSLPTSGKWYWEVTVSSVAEAMIGIQTRNNLAYAGPKTAYYRQGGSSNSIYIEGSANAYNASSYTNGDVIAVGYDADNSQIRWYKNNVQQGGPYTLTSLDNLTPIIIQASGSGSTSGVANFGQRPFAYTAPSGFKALCTQNLPEPTVVDGGEYFNAVLWTGNGATQTITTGLANDLVWTKDRGAAYDHTLFDVLRTPGYFLRSNATSAEEYRADSLTAFTSTGFSVGADSVRQNINKSGNSYVSWVWKAGGTGVTNTAGTITGTVTVSANTTAGFSIVTYTGTGSGTPTVGHGLGVAPSMIIIKSRSNAVNWGVGHVSAGWSNAGLLNDVNSFGGSSYFASTAPTSTVFSIQDTSVTNIGSATYVAYCFAPIAGFSAFGSYTGNGSTDGSFIYTGFAPRYILIKNASYAGTSWEIFDTARQDYNQNNLELLANSTAAEGSYTFGDILSNGFKLRSSNNGVNRSGDTLIYAAFAENPFKYSLAR